MSEAKELNFAVLKSMFGDYWIGKIGLKPDGKSIFPTFAEAMNKALTLNDSIENADKLEMIEEEDIEEIRPEMKKWIVG